MQPGPHHICPRCGEISDPSRIDVDDRVLECVHCGHRDSYRPLPPLFFLTGPSGGGKTSVHRHLLGRVQEAVLIDADLLWGLDPSHDDPDSGYSAFRGLVFALGMRLASNGRPVLIEGTTVPWEYERLPARPLVSRTAYLALVCDDDVLVERLRSRPSWRKSSREDEIAGMVRMNQAFKAESMSWDPPVALLDTSNQTIPETAAAVHEWLRDQIREG